MKKPHFKDIAKTTRVSLVCGLLLLASEASIAGNATTTVSVSVNVSELCVISGTAAATMNLLPLAAFPQDFVGPSLTVTCTTGTSNKQISIESGANDGAVGSTAHALSDGSGDYVGYDTYTTTNRNVVWGSFSSGNTLAATADGTAHSYTIFIRIPSGQPSAPNGNYTDTLTVAVSY